MKKAFIKAVLKSLITDKETRSADDWRGSMMNWTKC